jgi:magnesium transporter
MFDGDFLSHAKDLIGGHRWAELKDWLVGLPPSQVAQLLMELECKEEAVLFHSLPRDFQADVFSEMEPENQECLLKNLSAKEVQQLLADMPPDDRAALFSELPAQVTWKLYKLLSPEDLKEVKHILGYPQESVGRLMTPDYIAVRPDWKVGKILDYIRRKGKDSETISMIYVTDEKGKLLDDIRLRHLILADPEQGIDNLMKSKPRSISAFEDQENAVRMIRELDINALPVVDSNGSMVGIVTFDDLMDVQEKEVTEDFQKIAGITQTKDDIYVENIDNAPVTILYKKRVFWLVLLVFVNIFSGTAASFFEETIAKYIVLVFFMPLLIDSGGNAGAQASTLMVRALATGDVRQTDWFRMFKREFLVAGLLGITMGAAVSIVGVFRGGPMIALIVVLAMFTIVLIGSLIGVSLPFILTKIGKDPAIASGPLITSICDITGIIVYFSIAKALLIG